jgi:hypothetical protein
MHLFLARWHVWISAYLLYCTLLPLCFSYVKHPYLLDSPYLPRCLLASLAYIIVASVPSCPLPLLDSCPQILNMSV